MKKPIKHALCLIALLLITGCSAKTTLNPVGMYSSIANAQKCAAEIWARSRVKMAATPGAVSNCLRYAFHDAGTYDKNTDDGGCNGSIHLELGEAENQGLGICTGIVAQTWSEMQSVQGCAGTSIADTTQVAGAAAVAMFGGPACPILMGRPDRNDGKHDVTTNLPPSCGTVDGLLNGFIKNGFKNPIRSLVVLSGAHNIGRSRQTSDDTPGACSRGIGGLTNANNKFDGHYYSEITQVPNPNDPLGGPGWFKSDNQLVNGGNPDTRALVFTFAANHSAFLAEWCDHYQEMSLLGVAADPSFFPISTDWLPANLRPTTGVPSPVSSPPPPNASSPPPPDATASPPPPTASSTAPSPPPPDATSPPPPDATSPPPPDATSPPPPVVYTPPPPDAASPPPPVVYAPPPPPDAASPPPPVVYAPPPPDAASPPPPVVYAPPPPVVYAPPPPVVNPSPTPFGYYLTCAAASQTLQWGVLGQLLKFANSGTLNALLSQRTLKYAILVPGNGPTAQNMLKYLATLRPATASALAQAIISYHLIPLTSKTNLSPAFVKISRDYSTRLSSSPLYTFNTVSAVSVKLLSGVTAYAAGIGPGATFSLTVTVSCAQSTAYLLSDLLLPPSYGLSYPPAIKGTATWNMPLSPLSGLATISKTITTSWSGKNEGSSFYNLIFQNDLDLKNLLTQTSTAYTIFVPTNAAIASYAAKRFLQLRGFRSALIRHHVITTRALRSSDFLSNNAVVTYSTLTKSSGPLYIAGSVTRVVTLLEVCPSKKKGQAPKTRRIPIRRSDVIAGKSIIHYIDTVLDLCDP